MHYFPLVRPILVEGIALELLVETARMESVESFGHCHQSSFLVEAYLVVELLPVEAPERQEQACPTWMLLSRSEPEVPAVVEADRYCY